MQRITMFFMTCLVAAPFVAAQSIDLAGTWAFRLDPQDQGIERQWFNEALPERIELPGVLQAQGYGSDVSTETEWIGTFKDSPWYSAERYEAYRQPGNVKFPYCLQPDKHYVGPAWYQKTVDIPADWAGKRITLTLQRPHWYTDVWVDGQHAASGDSLSVSHEYDLTEHLAPGRHTVTLRVHNGLVINVGPNSHSVSDHTQSAWNGIAGRIELAAGSPIWIKNVQVYPRLDRQDARVVVTVENSTTNAVDGTLNFQAEAYNTDKSHARAAIRVQVNVPAGETRTVEAVYPLGPDMLAWDEFSPALYRLRVDLVEGNDTVADTRAITFGMREVSTRGTRVTINGRAIFLRGTLECCIFPKTGYPPLDVDSWKRIIRVCKAHGLNHMRFHSWCPPEAAFVAADELGFYFHVEASSWANQSATIGDGGPFDAWIRAEADRILERLGNHPSFIMMAYGNEPAGDNLREFLGHLVDSWKQKDPRRIYTSGAGWPIIPENQYHVTPTPRIQRWGEGLKSRINGQPPATMADYRDFVRKYPDTPVVAHEIGQWCVYPNFDEMAKYTGYLKPKNFEIFHDFLEKKHMADQARLFLMASGKLQILCYKEDIESALRTPGFGGFQLLDLHDFPGQGTALVGVLDPFWDSKPYVSAEEYSRFCNDTVVLARLPQRTFTTADTLEAGIEVSHFGPADLPGARLAYRLVDHNGEVYGQGFLSPVRIPTGDLTAVGRVSIPLASVVAPRKVKLVVGIEGTSIENDWDLWVYPHILPVETPSDVFIARDLNDAAKAQLRSGGKVLLVVPPHRIAGDVELGFSSVFWNTAWTKDQAPHTLGILCDPDHAVFASFPTEYHTNWQWWQLIHWADAMVLDGLPGDLRPLIQPIDTWFHTRRLGLLFEVRALGGKLMVCSIDLDRDLQDRPVARQLRKSLLDYMAGPAFDPAVEIEPAALEGSVFKEPSRLRRLGAEIAVDSFHPGNEPDRAVDGNPTTIWHTSWEAPADPLPHYFTICLPQPTTIAGLTYLPRSDMSNGRIAKYNVLISDDGETWSAPIASGAWPDSRQQKTIRFDTPVTTRCIRLKALTEVRGQPYTSAAEIDLLLP